MISFFKKHLAGMRAWLAQRETPDAQTDPDLRTEVQAYLAERRAEMAQWLIVVRAGLALGLAAYLALDALMRGAAWPTSALLLAAGYAAANGAVRLGATQGTRWRQGTPWACALLDVGLVAGIYGFWGSALGTALAPGVILVGLLVLVLLICTLLGHPALSAGVALAALGVAACVFYVFPSLAAQALPASSSEAPLRAYLLVEYLSIACLVTCMLALRLKRRLVAHRTELHRRLRTRLEADLEADRRRQVEAVGRLKRDFISVLSHELRNPIAPLLSSLDVAQQDAAKGRCSDGLIDIAMDSARQLEQLVNDYTRLARLLTRPTDNAERHNVLLAPLVEAVTERLVEEFAKRPTRHLPGAPPGPQFACEALADQAVASDPPLLIITLHALMRRAARYASGGTVTVRGLDEKHGEAGFTVHDPQSHLDQATIDSLDDLFAPTDERLYSERASGLELLLARHALHHLGGNLDVESSAEHGTTVRCTLPAASSEHDWVKADEVFPVSVGSTATPTPPSSPASSTGSSPRMTLVRASN